MVASGAILQSPQLQRVTLVPGFGATAGASRLPRSTQVPSTKLRRATQETGSRSSRRMALRVSATSASPLESSASASTGKQSGWFYADYGGPGVLEFASDLPVPELAPDQVRIKVAAAGLNPVDFKRREGKFKNTDSPLPTVPGYDVAGTVVDVGSTVTKFKKGDEVYSNISEQALTRPKQFGSLAQFTATEESLVALKPKNLSFIEAAAVPLAALTAQEAFDRAGFKAGGAVLILNGAGGVGSFAIQLARHVFGAGFIATTASAAKAELLKGLGADLVIDYKTEDYWTRPERYDFVLDAIGDGPNAVKVLNPEGQAKVLTGAIPEGARAERFVVTSRGHKLAELTPYFENGLLKTVLDPSAPYAFNDALAAFAKLESGRATGKIVVGPIS